MTVRPFDLKALPRVPGGDLAAARRARVRFGAAPRSLELTVARFGRVSLTFGGVMHATPPTTDEFVWRLRRPADASSQAQGWLVMANAAGLRIVSAILGIPGPRVHRALGTTERGVLAAAVSAVMRHAPGLTLAGARCGEWSGSSLGRVEGWAESETFREAFFLDVPPAWIPEALQTPLVERLRASAFPVSLTVELARTTITAEEWSRARPGDAVVFDDDAGAGRAPLAPVVVCGGFAAPAIMTMAAAAGELRLTHEFSPRHSPERNPMANDPDRDITTTVLAAAPIEVVAELGRLTLPADEVTSLTAGAVLALPTKAQLHVELRIGARLWAEGELVDLDGQLAVRLTRVTAPAGHSDASAADTVP